MEQDEKQLNEEPERDEMEDLDVSQQDAEDVKGGARYGRFPKPRGQ